MADRFLRLSEVRARIPYSRAAIYLKMARGEFPRQISLGGHLRPGAVAWLESEIDAWIASRVAGASSPGKAAGIAL
jgi:prophage regulatory protein